MDGKRYARVSCVRLLSRSRSVRYEAGLYIRADLCVVRYIEITYIDGVPQYISRRRGNIDLHYTTERVSISVGTEAPRSELLELFSS